MTDNITVTSTDKPHRGSYRMQWKVLHHRCYGMQWEPRKGIRPILGQDCGRQRSQGSPTKSLALSCSSVWVEVGGVWPSGLAKGREWKKKDRRTEQELRLLGLVTELDFLLRVKCARQGNVMLSFTFQEVQGRRGSLEVTQPHGPSQQPGVQTLDPDLC